MLEQKSLGVFLEAVKKLDAEFGTLPNYEAHDAGLERLAEVLGGVAERLRDNYPFFHPLYAGQMLKPPHPVARLAYALAMWINPNNHALDGGRATSAMEKEAVAEIAAMFGWKSFLGHLCGGGTMANLEALWVAGQLQPIESGSGEWLGLFRGEVALFHESQQVRQHELVIEQQKSQHQNEVVQKRVIRRKNDPDLPRRYNEKTNDSNPPRQKHHPHQHEFQRECSKRHRRMKPVRKMLHIPANPCR